VRRLNFEVVTLVLTLLVGLGLTATLMQPHIPQREPSGTSDLPEFLREGARHDIRWYRMDEAAFSEARRQNRPILLVIGGSWSRLARQVDEQVFSTPDIQNYIARNYIAIRVDAMERPEWLNAFLPVSRARQGFLVGFQCWLLDSRGRMYDLISRSEASPLLDRGEFLNALIGGRQRFDAMVRTPELADPPGLAQRADLEMIGMSSPEVLPNFRSHLAAVLQEGDPEAGGFVRRGFQIPNPNAWRFLAMVGNEDALRRSLDPALASSWVDVLDGGFFRLSTRPDWQLIEFDKLAVQNADMMLTLALAGRLTGDRFYRHLAERTFDSLSGEFVAEGFVRAARIWNQTSMSRSARASFAPRVLRGLFPEGSDREWLRTHLGMVVEVNPQMTPRYVRPEVIWEQPDRLESVLKVLRGAGTEPRFSGGELLDVNGHVAARMFEVARLWDDSDRLAVAGALFDRLDAFRVRDSVVHGLRPPSRGYAYLGDYLAYADAALQDFLASGRVASLEMGLPVLQRALFLFQGPLPGWYRFGLAGGGRLEPQDVHSPEIADNLCESATARLVRLCLAYGRLYLRPAAEETEAQQGLELLRIAYAATSLFAPVSTAAASPFSGYFCAVAALADDAHAFTVGRNAVAEANVLARRVPVRLVAPAIGPVRVDLQDRAPGVYIVRGGDLEGPLSVDEAAGRMGPTFRLP
jgi:uncharacterized protein